MQGIYVALMTFIVLGPTEDGIGVKPQLGLTILDYFTNSMEKKGN